MLQLRMSGPQTGSLRLKRQVFLAACGGDRAFLTSPASALRLCNAVIACGKDGVERVVYLKCWQLAPEGHAWPVHVTVGL